MASLLTTCLLVFLLTHPAFGSYAPYKVTCPVSFTLSNTVYSSVTLLPSEEMYLRQKRAVHNPALWENFVTTNTGYDYNQLFKKGQYPTLSFSLSGGGYRAAIFGAGVLDSLAQLVPMSDYLAGLSGGSWLVASMVEAGVLIQGMPNLRDLILGQNGFSGWKASKDIWSPAGLLGIISNAIYKNNIWQDIQQKINAGFPVSFVDTWSRALSYHFFQSTTHSNFFLKGDHAKSLTFSSLLSSASFQSKSFPIPLFTIANRVNDTSDVWSTSFDFSDRIPVQNTVFEATPFGFGSFEPTLNATVEMQYFGSYPSSGGKGLICVNGYDNIGFLIGASSGLFHAIQNVFTAGLISIVSTLFNIATTLQGGRPGVALVANVPNMFYGVPGFESNKNEILQLVDGGMAGETLPIIPLLVKSRSIDTIIAVDAVANTKTNYPSGDALLVTRRRVKSFGGMVHLPQLPVDENEFIKSGLNQRTVFFGCQESGLASAPNEPMIIYIPNRPSIQKTNYETLKTAFSNTEASSFLNAATEIGSRGFGGSVGVKDDNWKLCLECALVERARERALIPRSAACEVCFERYCWW